MSKNFYSSLSHKALEFAAMKHDGQFRKHPRMKVPYITHPAYVGLMLASLGYDEEVVSAGFLHDVIEDCGVSIEELSLMFSPKVAALVDRVSEPNKEFSWHERKDAYRKKMETADLDAIAIAACDHLHNLQSLSMAYDIDPDSINIFGASVKEKLDNEGKLLKIFKKRLPGKLTDLLGVTYQEVIKKIL